MQMEERKGENAWRLCSILRTLAGLFELLILLNTILWIWFPITLVNWKISSNYWIGLGIGLAIILPGATIMFKGIHDAGSETLKPSKDTEIYGGIYRFIRHPQSLGEFPLFVATGFLVNSWFLVLFLTIFIIVYVPVMIYYEEKDLIRRFGNKYREYQKRTGALFPKFKSLKNKTYL